jgi:methyl-accepting chemotaxis protein
MKWFNTLYAKLAIGLVLTLLVVGLLDTLSVTLLTKELRETANQKLNQHLAQNLVNDKRIVRDGNIDIAALKSTFMQYMSINPDIEIYFLDLNGKILSYSAEPGKVKRSNVNVGPIKQFLAGTDVYPLQGDDPRSHQRQKSFSVTVIPSVQKPEGYLYVVLQGEAFTNAQQAQSAYHLLSLAIPGLIASLVLGLLIGLYIFRRLTLRLRALQEKVSDFAESDFKQQNLFTAEQSKAGDEIWALENRFHQMSQHISEQWGALLQQDKLRREMIASISHDLRTPLAAAQGYLETIAIKGDKLSSDHRKQYLDIAIKQTNRLQA